MRITFKKGLLIIVFIFVALNICQNCHSSLSSQSTEPLIIRPVPTQVLPPPQPELQPETQPEPSIAQPPLTIPSPTNQPSPIECKSTSDCQINFCGACLTDPKDENRNICIDCDNLPADSDLGKKDCYSTVLSQVQVEIFALEFVQKQRALTQEEENKLKELKDRERRLKDCGVEAKI